MTSMSTPISKIPDKELSSNSESHEDDPEVREILEQAKNPVPVVHVVPQPDMSQPPVQQYYSQPVANQSPLVMGETNNIIDNDRAKKVLLYTIISMVVFYPKTLDIIYDKFPNLSQVATYDFFVRLVLLFVILYMLIWKFNI
jgi:hypothetical protein